MQSVKILCLNLVLIILLCSFLPAQTDFRHEIICNEICEVDSSLFFRYLMPQAICDTDSAMLINLFGPYFDMFPDIRSDILSALYYFPELNQKRIRFSYKPIRQTMNSRPSPANIFRKKANRHYTIIVNNNMGKYKCLPFEALSFNIKVGWLGHELAHTCKYETMNNWQTILFSIKYISSKKFVRRVERYTDMITIKHGLAFPLYDGTDYLLKDPGIDEKYRSYNMTNCLSLNEIKCLWVRQNSESYPIPMDEKENSK